jgi:spermidine synthase
MLFDSAVKTIHSVFPQIDFYRADGNIVTVAYPGDERKPEDLATVAQARDKAFGLRYHLQDMLAERRRIDIDGGQVIDAGAKVLTDDFAPVEALKSIERHNRKLP